MRQLDLAAAVCVCQGTVSLWEAKLSTPSIAMLEKICAAFGITMGRFYGSLPKRARRAA